MGGNISSAYCYRISGMYVPFETPENIEAHIDNYIAKIEKCVERLEDTFVRDDRKAFISELEVIMDMLIPVYAKQCISYVTALLDAANNAEKDPKYIERLLQQSIADLLLLSIEMQKARRLSTAHAVKYKDVEKNEQIAHALASIGRMLSTGGYRQAEELAEDNKTLNVVFIKLAKMIKDRQYDRAVELAESMEKEHISLIQKSGSAKMSKTILAVDDRQDILANVNAALRGHFRVLGALGAKAALEIMARQKIDLFYLDIEMPEMDGFELAQIIRSKPEHAKTPIIFLTANASTENIERGLSLGVDDYVVKPSNHVNLIVKARKHMDEA